MRTGGVRGRDPHVTYDRVDMVLLTGVDPVPNYSPQVLPPSRAAEFDSEGGISEFALARVKDCPTPRFSRPCRWPEPFESQTHLRVAPAFSQETLSAEWS
jgi:hypothetical protein